MSFAALEALAGATIGAVFDEAVAYLPMTAPPNGRRQPDPARPAIERLLVPVSRPVTRPESSFDIPSSDEQPRARRFGRSSSLYVAETALGYAPRQGDIVIMLAEAGAPRFSVERVDPDGAERFICRLVMIG